MIRREQADRDRATVHSVETLMSAKETMATTVPRKEAVVFCERCSGGQTDQKNDSHRGIKPEKVRPSMRQSFVEPACEKLVSHYMGSRFAWLTRNLPVANAIRGCSATA
jgi:hypothetical protein